MKPFRQLTMLVLMAIGAPWALEKAEIHTREIPGESIKELKAVVKMETSIDKLVSAYMDGDSHSKWFPNCASSRTVRKSGESRTQIYRLIDNPWPVRDRDYVIEVELIRNPETGEAVIQDRAIEGFLPEIKSAVRMDKIREQWTFTPTDSGRVLVTYILHFDPGGGTPAAFINMALSKIGNDLFDGLYRYAERTP